MPYDEYFNAADDVDASEMCEYCPLALDCTFSLWDCPYI